MFNRTSKMTALLVAAAAVTSIVPATAAERLGTKEGTITNAIAFDGAYVYDGYRTDDDDAGLYFNNGKDKMVDEDEDYSYDNLVKYGSKYALIQDGDEDFLVDLSSGKILDEESVEDKKDNAKSKLYTNLKKADRYENAKDKKDRDSAITEFNQIATNQFGEVWYQYTALGDETTGAGVEYTGFANESGKYIDIAQNANLYVYNGAGKTVKVSEYNKDKDGVEATFVDAKVIAQDSDYIYTVTTVSISGAKEGFDGEQYFVQKISKAQGEKKDGAYLPKSVTSYQLDKTLFDDSDVKTAANLLIDGTDGSYSVIENGVQVKNGNLYVTAVNSAKDSVQVYTLKLKKTKLDTADKSYKNVDTYVAISDSDEDQDIVSADDNGAAVAIDVDGNTWALNKGKIYKFTGSEFKEMFTCDRSLNVLDVYNDTNLIVWEEDGDVYTTVNEGKEVTDEEAGKEDDKTEEVVKSGWDKNADGTWSYYNNGAKATGWVQAGAWYYLNANGIMQTGWVNDNGTWYYCNASGAMQTGWLLDGSTWYYLQANGAMKTGWLNDNGTWYYLNANGSMAANTTVDGYKLGANGAWIR
ncbi:MAG: N-acetylmuramoyl-L-alanine amidase family protein [Clostridium butyricum]|nr:N-acetylmuramoyl-L-alanine amidase family protein [Clostridium butyricum]